MAYTCSSVQFNSIHFDVFIVLCTAISYKVSEELRLGSRTYCYGLFI